MVVDLRAGAGVADASGDAGGAVRGRRPGRHRRAHHGGAAVGKPRPAGDRRERQRRRQHDGRQPRRQGGARRLHLPARQPQHAYLQPDPQQEADVRRRQPSSRRSRPLWRIPPSSWCARIFRRRRSASSARSSAPTRASCNSPRRARARPRMSSAFCSTAPLASRSRTFPIAARRRRCRTSSAAASTISATSSRPRSRRSRRER